MAKEEKSFIEKFFILNGFIMIFINHQFFLFYSWMFVRNEEEGEKFYKFIESFCDWIKRVFFMVDGIRFWELKSNKFKSDFAQYAMNIH